MQTNEDDLFQNFEARLAQLVDEFILYNIDQHRLAEALSERARLIGWRRAELARENPAIANSIAIDLQYLDIPIRVYHCLVSRGIETLGELAEFTPDELMQIPHFGKKSLNDVVALLAGHGLVLRGN
jgi:DNA-directed RNA polymerase alpha subunit